MDYSVNCIFVFWLDALKERDIIRSIISWNKLKRGNNNDASIWFTRLSYIIPMLPVMKDSISKIYKWDMQHTTHIRNVKAFLASLLTDVHENNFC